MIRFFFSATAWDNYDLAIETLDGKNTLHVTVGICYQNFHPVLHSEAKKQGMIGTVEKPRRSFHGPVKEIPPCYSNMKLATFQLEQTTETSLLEQNDIDFTWLVKLCTEKLPLLNGYYSLFVPDTLPKTVIAYMDPISQPPTRNDVVQETMVRSLKVAAENKQEYAIVSYDLAVALKAYSIQSLKAPEYDKLIILLGVFHLELALFGALGTYIDDSGIEYILTEYGILAEGSLNGFLKGKFYNRCTRIHQLVAAVMEKAIFHRYIEDAPEEIRKVCEALLTASGQHDLDSRAQSEQVQVAMQCYEAYFQGLIKGSECKLAQFWAIYVYIVNRIHRLLQRAVRTNDLDLFLRVLPCTIELFFALNRPNYARWGSLFLDKLEKMPDAARKVLEAGAFSTRRTSKSYSRSPIDMTLEQTVNRDAASSATGITSFANSESAFRRWNVSLTQRSMAVSEMKDMCDIQPGETPANQLKKSRISRDNRDMEVLTKALEDTCNLFRKDAPSELVNIATGKVAAAVTLDYLTQVLEPGKELRKKFTDECATDDKRFLRTVSRCKVLNFARENLPKKSSREKKSLDAAEGVRDAFGYLLTAAAKSDEKQDLKVILSHPITEVPLSLAHADGSMNKTEKAAFTKILEGKQVNVLDEKSIGRVNASMFDGGLLMHEIIPSHSKSTYSKIARDFIVKVCSAPGDEVHLLLDRYITPSIKDPERQKRGGINDITYQITGSEQQQKQKGSELLNDACFKEQFGRLLLAESQKAQYGPVIREKTMYISHGGDCVRIQNTLGRMEVTRPEEMQGQHEEADTLIAFHVGRVERGTVVVRSSDTDVVVVLTALAARKPDLSIIMDYGTDNTRRFIDISNIATELEKQQPGLCDALTGFHSLTGCDFTSSFYRKGKKKPFEILQSDDDNQYLGAIQSLNSPDADYQSITAYVCRIYGAKRCQDIDEARYDSFMKMTGGNKVLTKVKKVNCSSLPPCKKSLHKHIQRANFVAMTWHNADQALPNVNCPLDFGWKEDNSGAYQPVWFEGPAIPGECEEKVEERQENEEAILDATPGECEDKVEEENEEESEGDWSGDSDESETDEI